MEPALLFWWAKAGSLLETEREKTRPVLLQGACSLSDRRTLRLPIKFCGGGQADALLWTVLIHIFSNFHGPAHAEKQIKPTSQLCLLETSHSTVLLVFWYHVFLTSSLGVCWCLISAQILLNL